MMQRNFYLRRDGLGYALYLGLALLWPFICLGADTEADEEERWRPQSPEEIFERLEPQDLADLIDPLTVVRRRELVSSERFQFRIGWGMFTVGSAEMSIQQGFFPDPGHPAVQMRLVTRTNAFADAFYRVRNDSWSWMTVAVTATLQSGVVQNEGDRHRNSRVDFDLAGLTALRHDFHSEEEAGEPIVIVPGTFDPLGIVHFVRTLDFTVGDRMIIPTTNGREVFFHRGQCDGSGGASLPFGRAANGICSGTGHQRCGRGFSPVQGRLHPFLFQCG